MNKKSLWTLLLCTPLFLWATHGLAYFIHEYCHSFSAWALGFKANPLALTYGHFNWSNVLLLQEVSENVDYAPFMHQHPWLAAFIAFAGPGIGNGGLLALSIWVLCNQKPRGMIYLYFFLWFAAMNLGNLISYVPVRTFATHGDMMEIELFLNISPWILMILFGYPVVFCLWYFYHRRLPKAYIQLQLCYAQRCIVFILLTLVIFGFFGSLPGLSGDYGDRTHFLSLLFMYMIPITLVSCWPKK